MSSSARQNLRNFSHPLSLVTDAGEELLRARDYAAFAHNVADGHHLINRSAEMAVYLEIGSRRQDDSCHYPDIDLHVCGDADYTHKDGTPCPATPGCICRSVSLAAARSCAKLPVPRDVAHLSRAAPLKPQARDPVQRTPQPQP